MPIFRGIQRITGKLPAWVPGGYASDRRLNQTADLGSQEPFGVLASEQSREAVDEVVVAHGRQPRRWNSRLPAHVMVYFALPLGLWSGDDCEQVMARLTDRWRPRGWDAGRQAPASGGTTEARQRLGSGVLADLYERLAEPITEILTPGAGSGRGGWWPWTAPWSTCTAPPPTTPTAVGLVALPCRGRSLRPGSWQCLRRLIS